MVLEFVFFYKPLLSLSYIIKYVNYAIKNFTEADNVFLLCQTAVMSVLLFWHFNVNLSFEVWHVFLTMFTCSPEKEYSIHINWNIKTKYYYCIRHHSFWNNKQSTAWSFKVDAGSIKYTLIHIRRVPGKVRTYRIQIRTYNFKSKNIYLGEKRTCSMHTNWHRCFTKIDVEYKLGKYMRVGS